MIKVEEGGVSWSVVPVHTFYFKVTPAGKSCRFDDWHCDKFLLLNHLLSDLLKGQTEQEIRRC
jgi:hypothetical protein